MLKTEAPSDMRFDKLQAAGIAEPEPIKRRFSNLQFGRNNPENVQAAMDKENGAVPTEPATDENGKPVESTDEKGEKPAEGGSNMLLIVVGILALVGGGAFYYFKVYKNNPKAPKQSDYSDEDEEDYEEETVNEDTTESEDDEM